MAEHDEILEQIAATDEVKYVVVSGMKKDAQRGIERNGGNFARSSNISLTRSVQTSTYSFDVPAQNIRQNISLYLSQSNESLPPPFLPVGPRQLPSGGLKLPPFPSRPRDGHNEVPKTVLTKAEADSMKELIFGQLDDLEGYVRCS